METGQLTEIVALLNYVADRIEQLDVRDDHRNTLRESKVKLINIARDLDIFRSWVEGE